MPPKSDFIEQKFESFKEQLLQTMSERIDSLLKSFLKNDINNFFLDIKREMQELV